MYSKLIAIALFVLSALPNILLGEKDITALVFMTVFFVIPLLLIKEEKPCRRK